MSALRSTLRSALRPRAQVKHPQQRQRSEACGIQEPHATLHRHVIVTCMSQPYIDDIVSPTVYKGCLDDSALLHPCWFAIYLPFSAPAKRAGGGEHGSTLKAVAEGSWNCFFDLKSVVTAFDGITAASLQAWALQRSMAPWGQMEARCASPVPLTHITRTHIIVLSPPWQAWRGHSGPLSAPRGSDIRRHHCCASAHAWPLSGPWAAAPVPRMVRAAPRMEPPRLVAM